MVRVSWKWTKKTFKKILLLLVCLPTNSEERKKEKRRKQGKKEKWALPSLTPSFLFSSFVFLFLLTTIEVVARPFHSLSLPPSPTHARHTHWMIVFTTFSFLSCCFLRDCFLFFFLPHIPARFIGFTSCCARTSPGMSYFEILHWGSLGVLVDVVSGWRAKIEVAVIWKTLEVLPPTRPRG